MAPASCFLLEFSHDEHVLIEWAMPSAASTPQVEKQLGNPGFQPAKNQMAVGKYQSVTYCWVLIRFEPLSNGRVFKSKQQLLEIWDS